MKYLKERSVQRWEWRKLSYTLPEHARYKREMHHAENIEQQAVEAVKIVGHSAGLLFARLERVYDLAH